MLSRVALSMTTSEKLQKCIEYYRQNKKWPDGRLVLKWNIGSFFYSLKSGSVKLTKEQRDLLDDTDKDWCRKRDVNETSKKLTTSEKFDRLVKYFNDRGDFPPTDYVCEDGLRLGKIFASIKIGHIKLSESQRQKLTELKPSCLQVRSIKPEARMSTSEKLQMCKQYYNAHDMWPPSSYRTRNGYNLGSFWNRVVNKKIKLTEDDRLGLISIYASLEI